MTSLKSTWQPAEELSRGAVRQTSTSAGPGKCGTELAQELAALRAALGALLQRWRGLAEQRPRGDGRSAEGLRCIARVAAAAAERAPELVAAAEPEARGCLSWGGRVLDPFGAQATVLLAEQNPAGHMACMGLVA